MPVEAAITDALFGRLRALTISPAHPIAWPNVAFTPPSSDKWLRVNQFPTVETRFAVADTGSVELRGFIQVDVFGPLNKGVTTQQAVAASVARHFRVPRRLFSGTTRIEITSARVDPGMTSDSRWMIPVTINYRAFALNT